MDIFRLRFPYSRLVVLPVLAGALFAGAAGLPKSLQADQTTDALESPPPLSADDLSRRINDDSDQVEPVVQPQTDQANADTSTDDVVTEYRVQERLYFIEVNPRLGGNYYLLDNDGDGSLDDYRQNAEADTNIGKWRIGSW